MEDDVLTSEKLYTEKVMKLRPKAEQYAKETDILLAEHSKAALHKLTVLFGNKDFVETYVKHSPELTYGLVLAGIIHDEEEGGLEPYIDECRSLAQFKERWKLLKFMLWEAEFKLYEGAQEALREFVKEQRITKTCLEYLVKTSAADKNAAWTALGGEAK